jgi:K+-transporting ATPase c subunit
MEMKTQKRQSILILEIVGLIIFGLFPLDVQAVGEVWFGGSTSYSINRLTFDGTPLSSISIGGRSCSKLSGCRE